MARGGGGPELTEMEMHVDGKAMASVDLLLGNPFYYIFFRRDEAEITPCHPYVLLIT